VSTVVKMVAARKTEKKAGQEKAERAKVEQAQREQRREQQRVEVRQRKAAAKHQKNLEIQWAATSSEPPPQKTPEKEKAGLTWEEKSGIMGYRAQHSPKGEGEGCDTSDWEAEDDVQPPAASALPPADGADDAAGAKVRPPAALTRPHPFLKRQCDQTAGLRHNCQLDYYAARRAGAGRGTLRPPRRAHPPPRFRARCCSTGTGLLRSTVSPRALNAHGRERGRLDPRYYGLRTTGSTPGRALQHAHADNMQPAAANK
jgi:hypothetical protein